MPEPCSERLDAECFKANPQWARQAFAYRLLHLLAPPQITRRLPRGLGKALIGPGAVLPPGMDLPPGTVVPPGGTVPPDWKPGDPLPPGTMPPPETPPGTGDTGTTTPSYLDPAGPGPTHKPSPPPPVTQVTVDIHSLATDGCVTIWGADWTAARNAPTGYTVSTGDERLSQAHQANNLAGTYYVNRSFFVFDLSAIPPAADILSATFTLLAYGSAYSTVSVQEGQQHEPLVTADFDAFTGSAFAAITWELGGGGADKINTFTLNPAGLAYLKSKFGTKAKLCTREHAHDYLNVSPDPPPTQFACGCYYKETSPAENTPTLHITYTV